MEFQIKRARKPRTLYLIGSNVAITCICIALVTSFGSIQANIEFVDLLLKGASSALAFLLFAAAAVVTVSGAHMSGLLTGLFLYQLGALLDAMDKVVTYPFYAWTVTGDIFILLAQIILAAVAFLFVSLTSRIADTDRLTELQNRSFHQRWIEQYLMRSDHPLAVIAIDLDAFKRINDTHGHDFGDKVLKHIGQLLKQFIRGHRGIASRTGGEEFEIALKRSDESKALSIAEELRSMIERSPPAGLDRVTASVGVALSQPGESATTLRKRADAAAYFSKQSGRNRVSLAGANQTISNISAS
jgi:diguanylate cyclase (GGDEF)-like protein